MTKPTLTHPVRFHGERSRWMVPSASQPDVPNFVDMDEPFCSCEDWHFRHEKLGPNYQCRHMKAVTAELEMLNEWMMFPIDNFITIMAESSRDDSAKYKKGLEDVQGTITTRAHKSDVRRE